MSDIYLNTFKKAREVKDRMLGIKLTVIISTYGHSMIYNYLLN